MKIMNKLLFLALVVTGFAACEKLEDLPLYGAGTVPELTSSAASVAPLPIDSNKAVLTLSWTDPAYATDSSSQKFLVQVDSSGRNFSKAVTKEVTGSLSYTFIAKELNAIMLGWGFEYNKALYLPMQIIMNAWLLMLLK
jgi:starch-binding outer membrane protein SusE/F